MKMHFYKSLQGVSCYNVSLIFTPLILAILGGLLFAEKIGLSEIELEIRDEGIFVKTSIQNAFNPELLEALNTGIPIEFHFQIQLMRKRWYWFNKKVTRAEVLHLVSFDTLNKQYKFTSNNGDSPTTRITESLEECIEWMTRLEVLLPFQEDIDYGKGQYYIKVFAESRCTAPGTFKADRESSRKFSLSRQQP